PKRLRPWAVDTDYGRHPLDNTRFELHQRYHRDVSADDPWLSPQKSEAIQALLLYVESAQVYQPPQFAASEEDLDLEIFCKDAQLTERQTQVLLMTGDGLGVVEIARVLDISHPTVIQHLHYARHKLAGWL